MALVGMRPEEVKLGRALKSEVDLGPYKDVLREYGAGKFQFDTPEDAKGAKKAVRTIHAAAKELGVHVRCSTTADAVVFKVVDAPKRKDPIAA